MKYFFLILLLLISKTAHAKEIQGTPLVVDGDTIKINLNKIRLEGIDAPEIKQQCKKKYSKNLTFFSLIKKNYSCGIVSKKKLIAKINTSKIKCISSDIFI